MLISLLKLKQLYLGNGWSDRKNNDIFDPKGLKESLIGQFWPYKAWWCQISNKNEVWPTFPKMIIVYQGVVLQSLRPIGYSVK